MTPPTIHIQHWPHTRRWIITAEGGSVQLELYREPRQPYDVKAFIWGLWVEPEHRRKGIATALLDIAEDIARREGEPAVWLEWSRQDDTIPEILDWYLRRDYRDIAFSGNGDSVLLKKDLL